ncbi:MAG: ShlB/FhaC/HecB family hemolysin secretion/activation protein [Novosphingobium sp.]|nr:ShlB/FhaC/HecB family hemolysin secretion/activation protein [Novosphingobium sp.]
MGTKIDTGRNAIGYAASGRAIALLCVPALALSAQAALGQTETGVNEQTTIDRDRVDRRAPQVSLPPAGAEAPQGSVEVAPGAGGAENVRLARVRYEGSTLPAETLNAATAPYIGQPLTRENLQKIANAVSAAYAASDIAFYGVSIPAQAPTGGELTLRVLEGRIVRYTLAKETPSMPTRLIRKTVQHLLDETPAHRSTIERTLSLLRDIPGQTVDAQIKRTGVPGELVLDLDVKRNQIELSLNVNNRGVTNVISGVQTQVGVAVNGLLREGDSTRISAYLPLHPDRYQYYSAVHSTPIGANGTRLSFNGAYVRTLTQNNIRGTAKLAGITLSHPLIRSYKRNLTLSVGLDGTNSDNYFLDTQFGGFKTRALRFSGAWSSVGKKGGYAASLTLTQGIDGLGAEPFVGYSEAGFRKANLQLAAVQKFGERVTLRGGILGQYSNDLLPTTERFSMGGPGGGAAFNQGVVTAESALSGNIELSCKAFGPAASSLGVSLFGFADGGIGRSLARPAYLIPERSYSLASAGFGVRISPAKGWVGSAQLAFPVKSPLPNLQNDTRFLFSISKVL